MPLTLPEPLASARLVIRPATRADLPGLMHVNGDAEVTRFLPYPAWTTAAVVEAWYERMTTMQADGSALQLVVLEKASGAPIGTCLLFRLDEGSQRVELGYALGRSHWGAGYMLEAARTVIDHVFNGMGLRRIEAQVNPANTPSVRLLQRLGFAQEGILRERWVNAARQAYDVALFGLLRHEYPAGRSAHITAVHLSAGHHFSKQTVAAIELVAGQGVLGDAHCGATVQHRSRVARSPEQPNLRQVHLLQAELMDELATVGHPMLPGQMGENITTRGLDLLGLSPGTRLRLGADVLLCVTGLRNPCQQIEDFQPGLLAAVRGRDVAGNLIRKAGVMCTVERGGQVRAGDTIRVEHTPTPARPLQPV